MKLLTVLCFIFLSVTANAAAPLAKLSDEDRLALQKSIQARIPVWYPYSNTLYIPIVEFSEFGLRNVDGDFYPENQYLTARVKLNPNGTWEFEGMPVSLYCRFSPFNPICP